MILSVKSDELSAFEKCGTKAFNLARMWSGGFNVPDFICIEKDDLLDSNKIKSALRKAEITEPYAVRSSSKSEDGSKMSYAGQFSTFIDVSEQNLMEYAEKCFETENRLDYSDIDEKKRAQSGVLRAQSGTSRAQSGTSRAQSCASDEKKPSFVIIQAMIPSEISGVMFTQNPLGIISENVIVAGNGRGINVVEDKTQVITYYYNIPDGKEYFVKQENAPELSTEMREELHLSASAFEKMFGAGVDVEFSVAGMRIYYLQARKITTLEHKEEIIIDNSNIVESYPGITLPLTADFVSRQYTSIFESVITRLSGTRGLVRKNKEVFSQMAVSYNGRMYYHITNWYGIIGLLPFYKKIIPVWQEMLGVSEHEVSMKLLKASLWQKVSVAVHTVYYFFRAPAKMRFLNESVERVDSEYEKTDFEKADLTQLRNLYNLMQGIVMEKWDYTLINDMYTFLYTGLFQSLLRRKNTPEDDIQRAISDISYLASLQPVKNVLNLAVELKEDGVNQNFMKRFGEYLQKYGNRTAGELKLETATFREEPQRLMDIIKQYAEMPQLKEVIEKIGTERETIKYTGMSKYFLSCIKKGIQYREQSRMNRTHLFGIARSIFLRAGEILFQAERIESARDVFYLSIDEIFSDGDICYVEIVNSRKELYSSYERYPVFTRVSFDGKIVQKPHLTDYTGKTESGADNLRGIPCSAGKVAGKVILVENPEDIKEAAGKIIVTYSTDPGWVFMLTEAKGLISEKGSILSHTAIVARELHIPMIASVENVMSQLHTGDVVEMDCMTGIVSIIRQSGSKF